MKINEHYRLEQKNNTNNKKHYSTMWKNREIYQTPINKAPILSEITGPITLPVSLPITEPIMEPIIQLEEKESQEKTT